MKKITFVLFLLFPLLQNCEVSGDPEMFELILQIKNQNEELLTEVKSLQSKSDSLINEIKNGAAKQEELMKKVIDLQLEMAKVLSQIGILSEQLNSQGADLEAIKSQLVDLKEKYQGILEQLEQLQKLSQILAEIETLKGQLSELDSKYEVILGSLAKNEEELTALKAQIEALQSQLTENLTAISELTSQLGEQGADIENILAQIEELKASCEEIKTLLEDQLSGKSPLPTNGLAGWWPFNGNANDESGNGNNGVVIDGILTDDISNQPNSAYIFNGQGSNIQFNKPFFGGGQVSEFSINTRVFFNDLTNSPNIWGKTKFWGEVNLQANSDGSFFIFWANSVTGNRYSGIKSDTGVLDEGKWFDLTVVFNSGGAQLYLNGLPINTTLQWASQGGGVVSNQEVEKVCNFDQDSNSSKLGVRITSGKPGNYLDGIIDDFAIWNRALLAEEILKIYNGEGF
jgi:peptidoglycan hydrolase CwlO-like protein